MVSSQVQRFRAANARSSPLASPPLARASLQSLVLYSSIGDLPFSRRTTSRQHLGQDVEPTDTIMISLRHCCNHHNILFTMSAQGNLNIYLMPLRSADPIWLYSIYIRLEKNDRRGRATLYSIRAHNVVIRMSDSGSSSSTVPANCVPRNKTIDLESGLNLAMTFQIGRTIQN